MRLHDSQLAYHVMLYAVQALGEGDFAAIEDLGFTTDEIQQLSQLSVKALAHLSRLSGHFLNIKTDHQCFLKMMDHLQYEIEREVLQDELIRHEAPITMMISLFGISSGEYIQRQKLLGIPSHGAGRPPQLTDEEQVTVWHSWVKVKEQPIPERYITLAKETGHPLRVLWSLIQSWENSEESRSVC